MIPKIVSDHLKSSSGDVVGRLRLNRTSQTLRKLACWIDFSRWRIEYSSGNSLDLSPKYDYKRRYLLYDKVVKTERLVDAPIDYLEFGVYRGNSLRWWIENIKTPDSRFVGFDCFTGLPERWTDHPVGAFDTGGKAPEIWDERCSFEIGLFQDTLPGFLALFEGSRRTVIHMDADIYSSTLFVLSALARKLKPRDILFFDEFSSPANEFCAFQEYSSCFQVKYQLIGAVNNCEQVALKLI